MWGLGKTCKKLEVDNFGRKTCIFEQKSLKVLKKSKILKLFYMLSKKNCLEMKNV